MSLTWILQIQRPPGTCLAAERRRWLQDGHWHQSLLRLTATGTTRCSWTAAATGLARWASRGGGGDCTCAAGCHPNQTVVGRGSAHLEHLHLLALGHRQLVRAGTADKVRYHPGHLDIIARLQTNKQTTNHVQLVSQLKSNCRGISRHSLSQGECDHKLTDYQTDTNTHRMTNNNNREDPIGERAIENL